MAVHSKPCRAACVRTWHIVLQQATKVAILGTRSHMQWEIPMYDLVVAILGIAYPVMIIGFIVGAIVITFGGRHR